LKKERISHDREVLMHPYDDDLSRFEADGAAPLPVADDQGYIERNGARIWYATYGSGAPVILLHGGLGHGGNWGYQVPALVGSGYRAVLIDSRGHGRSTRDAQAFSYELMASDVLAVMDALHLEKASLVGWSDGACTALILAAKTPARIAGVFFFGCNMDPSGVKPFEATATVNRCLARHAKDYAHLSATPEHFKDFVDAVTRMQQTQPNYSAKDLAQISVSVVIVQSEHDEFIKQEHAEYLARSIPNAELVVLNGVSHFAPLQRPEQFNSAMLAFLHGIHEAPPLTKEQGVWVLHTGQSLPASAADDALEREREERDLTNRGQRQMNGDQFRQSRTPSRS
jgi:pimeloyl-ACP methyl ester carboxylesterase